MIALAVFAIIESLTSKTFSYKSFFKNKAYSGLLLVFVAILLSGFNSDDLHPWLLQIKLKLPFVFLPFTFFVFKPWIDQRLHRWIHFAFITTAVISTFHVIGVFLIDKEAITSSIGKGKSIPTPLDHIHYSIMVAYAVVSTSIFAILESNKRQKWALFLISAYLFGFMHFLSVRTGLALSYVGIGLTLIWYVLTHKKYLLGLGVAAFLVAIPFIAFKTIEPFKRKINYMFWDLAQYKQGKGNSYSDSERIMSYNISLDLISEKPLFGHGVGDLRPIMEERHKELYGQKDKYIFPHNQYLYILTCIGILGAFVFFFGLLSPLLFVTDRNVFLFVLFALMLISFLVENTIQRAVITGFFLFFILLNLSLPSSKQVK